MRDIAGNQSTSTDDAIKDRLKRLKDTGQHSYVSNGLLQ